MTHRFVRVVAVIAATTGTACLAQAAPVAAVPAGQVTVSAEDLAALRAQLQALQERLAQLHQVCAVLPQEEQNQPPREGFGVAV